MNYILDSYLNDINDEIITESLVDNFKNIKTKILNAVKNKDTEKFKSLANLIPKKESSKINEMAYKKMPEWKKLHKQDMRNFKIKDPNGIESNIVLSYTMFKQIHDNIEDGKKKEKVNVLLEKYGKIIQKIGGLTLLISVIMNIIVIIFLLLEEFTSYESSITYYVGENIKYVIIIGIVILIIGSLLRIAGYVKNKIEDKHEKD